MEFDTEEAKTMSDAESEVDDLDIPAQLRFEHFDHNIKEVRWSVCLKDTLVCTGEVGIQTWKPSIELCKLLSIAGGGRKRKATTQP